MKLWMTNVDPSIIICKIGYNNKYGSELRISHYISSDNNGEVSDTVLSTNIPIINTEKISSIGNSIFSDYNAIKMANIDAVFKITPHVTSIRDYQNVIPFTFCDLMDDNGGYTEYLQWRMPNSVGYGFNSKKWNLDIVDMFRLNLDPGVGFDSLIKFIKSRESHGIDLVLGIAENNSSMLLLMLMSLVDRCCKIGGYFICKIMDLNNFQLSQIIFITKHFEKVSLFKPLACYNNNERYIVCSKFKGNMSLEEKLPAITKDFFDWIDRQNTVTLTDIPIEQINCDKALLIWNLPGNIDPKLHV